MPVQLSAATVAPPRCKVDGGTISVLIFGARIVLVIRSFKQLQHLYGHAVVIDWAALIIQHLLRRVLAA